MICFLGGLVLLAGFLLAASLAPAEQGYGTHQQLGLPPCTIQFLFGIPCPSCGMTTSFAWFVRGQILASMRANVGGTTLASGCLILMISLWRFSWTGIAPPWKRIERTLIVFLTAFLIISCAQWAVRFFLGSPAF
ncbi:MAG: DUF2752 domain-containing protein [Planctomycetaceae bacterium]|nr:DUF2752 domain-containing protein [Planctomycetaceae bacterium]